MSENKLDTYLYFNSESAAIIFFLLELDGETRMNKLGSTQQHFIDFNLAQTWYKQHRELIQLSHHPKKEQALIKLEQIYKQMVIL